MEANHVTFRSVITSSSLVIATLAEIAVFTPASQAADTPPKGVITGYAAVGEIHPSNNKNWCLSVTSQPPSEPGDRVFISECGEKGTYQQWSAERVRGHGDIQVLGAEPPLALTNKGALGVVTNPDNVDPPSFGIQFVPRGSFWEIQVPWYHLRPLSTAVKLKNGVHYTVFWQTLGDIEWVFPKWEEVS
jgi:hypothetical protein